MTQALSSTASEVLSPDQLRDASRVRTRRVESSGRDILQYLLPDRITCIGQEQLFEESSSGARKSSRSAPQVMVYGNDGLALDDPAIMDRTVLLTLDNERFFTTAFVPIGQNSQKGILLWVAVELSYALQQLDSLRSGKKIELAQRRQIACVANLIFTSGAPCGLFALAQIEQRDLAPHPFVAAFDDQYTPFPGIDALSSASIETQLEQFEAIAAAETAQTGEEQRQFEHAILTHNFVSASELLHTHRTDWLLSSRSQFAAGCLYLQFNDYQAAAEHFHQAQLLDHPAALRGEWTCQHGLAQPLRKAHPEIFASIRRGDRLQVLTVLRAVAERFPLAGPAILSYCLRRAGVPEEGLHASDRALEHDRNQSDVLSNKWRYLIDLRRDDAALETAREHLLRFPQDQSAVRNLIDSLLLNGKPDEAELLAERYAIFSTNAGITAKQFFRVYEALEAWDELLIRYRELLRYIPRPSSATLAAYGEILTETGDFDESYEIFERALTLDPGNGKVILGYARSLARSDKEVEAECLLATALADKNRIDNYEDRVFILTLLAEIQRRTGRAVEALRSFEEFLVEDISVICRKAGPLPGIELIEVYLANGRRDDAHQLAMALSAMFPDDPFVIEMQQAAA